MSDLPANPWVDQLISSIPSGLLVLDEELRVRRANLAFGSIFGVDPKEITGCDLVELLPIDGLRERAQSALRSGQSLLKHSCQWRRRGQASGGQAIGGQASREQTSGEQGLRALELSIHPVEAPEPDGASALLLLVDDHTEQEELRTRARLSEGGFREVIEHSPDGIVVHRNGKALYINPSLLELFDVDNAAQIIGNSVYDFVHPDEHADLQARVKKLLDGTDYLPVRETRLLRSDGSQWVAELTARRVIFEGEPAIASIARDVTERKKMTAQMMQMDRMIAAGTLAAGVGHEINNPLTYVTGNIGFALESIGKLEKSLAPTTRSRVSVDLEGLRDELRSMRDALVDAQEGSIRIRDIVSQLRTFSPDEQGARATIPVQAVIESVLGMVSNEIRHRARLVMEFDGEPCVYGNENKLGQVFLNLLINAAHAIDEGAYEANEIRIRTEASDPWTIVEVCDTGSGISPDELSRIFDPFFTTKPVGQGTGLGLYICQRIVESHGGRIEVESEPGEGTVVRTLLPRARQTDPLASGDESSAQKRSSRGARILVIDDEPMIGRSIARTLGPTHQVTCLSSARAALEQLDGDDVFDLILCDLMMPDLSGMDFYQHVAETFPKLADAIAFITGGAFTPRALEFLEQTDNPCLDKPLDVDDLRTLVRQRVKR